MEQLKEPQRIVVFDFDCTLANPKSRDFYANHSEKTLACIANYFDITKIEAKNISNSLKNNGFRHELALFQSNLVSVVAPQIPEKPPETTLLHTALSEIDPTGHFLPDPALVASLRELHTESKLCLISNSPMPLVQKIAGIIGFDLEKDFDYIDCYHPDAPMPKMVNPEKVFESVKQYFGVTQRDMIFSVGDTLKNDITPAKAKGFSTIFITEDVATGDSQADYAVANVFGAFNILKKFMPI